MLQTTTFTDPVHHFSATTPDQPVLYFSKADLNARIAVFQNGLEKDLGGTLCYAVKCNPRIEILSAMVEAGMEEFDVASPREISLLRDLAPHARLNYNNPIRSRKEIQFALDHGVKSFSVDCIEELEKLAALAPKGIEVSIRLTLNLNGAAYHFGDKFGETTQGATQLMKRAHALGFITSATFHVGTQCETPANYRLYMQATAQAAKDAGITLTRLNVGGGFPSARNGVTPNFQAYFDEIKKGLAAFDQRPQLLAEPGRALVADACQYLVQIKSIRKNRWAFLNDGVYGGLSDVKLMGTTPYRFYAPEGTPRQGAATPHKLYGPTCDSIDSFAETFDLPAETAEEDYMLFNGAGAYLVGLDTKFNGYGEFNFCEVTALS